MRPIFVAFLILAGSSTSFAAVQCAAVAVSKSATAEELAKSPLSLAELREKVFAVHATNHFPSGGVIVADKNPNLTVRPELHFSLGALVASHSLGDWEQSRYAVVTPVKNLEPQLLNLFIHDTTILGDFVLPKGTVIVIPEGDAAIIPEGVIAQRYKPNQTSLRDAIVAAIHSQNGLEFDVSIADGTQRDWVSSNDDPRLNDNLNQGEFLAPLLRDHLGVSSTVHSSTNLGAIDMWISSGIGGLTRNEPYDIKTSQLSFERDVIALSLKSLKAELPWNHLPQASKVKLQDSLLRIKGYLNIADADLRLRKKTGQTALLAPSKFKADLLALMQNQSALDAYYKNHESEFDLVEQPGVIRRSNRFAMKPLWLGRFTATQVRELYVRHRENFTDDESTFLASYAKGRLMTFGFQLTTDEIKELTYLSQPKLATMTPPDKRLAASSLAPYSTTLQKIVLEALNSF